MLYYPVPRRTLRVSEQAVREYLVHETVRDRVSVPELSLFALEGGATAMTYILFRLGGRWSPIGMTRRPSACRPSRPAGFTSSKLM